MEGIGISWAGRCSRRRAKTDGRFKVSLLKMPYQNQKALNLDYLSNQTSQRSHATNYEVNQYHPIETTYNSSYRSAKKARSVGSVAIVRTTAQIPYSGNDHQPMTGCF